MSVRRGTDLTCPSAQTGMSDVQVLGIVTGSPERPRVAYMNGYVPATEEVLADAHPLPATQVLRLAAKCEERRCAHFDGHLCQLATRIVRMLDEVVDALPACVIRKSCRWFEQEGRPACLRCPQIVTSVIGKDDGLAKLARFADVADPEGREGKNGSVEADRVGRS